MCHLIGHLRSALDILNRTELYKALYDLNISIKVKLVKVSMKNVYSAINIKNEVSRELSPDEGLETRGILDCLQFNLLLVLKARIRNRVRIFICDDSRSYKEIKYKVTEKTPTLRE